MEVWLNLCRPLRLVTEIGLMKMMLVHLFCFIVPNRCHYCSVFQESISPVRRGTDSSEAMTTATARGIKRNRFDKKKTTVRSIQVVKSSHWFHGVLYGRRSSTFTCQKTTKFSFFFFFRFFVQSLRILLQKKFAKFDKLNEVEL